MTPAVSKKTTRNDGRDRVLTRMTVAVFFFFRISAPIIIIRLTFCNTVTALTNGRNLVNHIYIARQYVDMRCQIVGEEIEVSFVGDSKSPVKIGADSTLVTWDGIASSICGLPQNWKHASSINPRFDVIFFFGRPNVSNLNAVYRKCSKMLRLTRLPILYASRDIV